MWVKLMTSILVDNKVIFRNVEAVLFDKDGTLIDIHHYWSEIIRIRALLVASTYFKKDELNRVKASLIKIMGFNKDTKKLSINGPIGVKPRPYIVNIVAEFVRKSGHPISNSEVEVLFQAVDVETSKNMLKILKVLPGVEELLKKLNKAGVFSIITSVDITDRASMAMKTLNLDHFFTKIIGGDLVTNSKPYPDLANLALKNLNCKTNNVVVIGDHPVDIKMGENIKAGLNIAVLTGISDINMFKNLNCTVINDLSCIEVF